MNKLEFSEKIKQALVESGKTRSIIANSLEIALRTVDNWCTGYSLPDIESLQKYATITNKPVLWFFGMDTPDCKEIESLKKEIAELKEERDAWRKQAATMTANYAEMLNQLQHEFKLMKSEIDQLKRSQGNQ